MTGHKDKSKRPEPGNPMTVGARFRTPDTGLVAFVMEFEDVKMVGTTREVNRMYFILDIDEAQGHFYEVKYQNSDFLQFENRRKSLVDITHKQRPQQGPHQARG